MKHNLTVIILLLFINASYSQNQPIKGYVSDNFKTSLQNAYIHNINNEHHTHSLDNGFFSLPENDLKDTLEIKLLGYKTKKIVLKEKDFSSPINITLTEEVFQLDELVLKQEVDPINLLAKFDLATNPVNSSQDLLQKVPGLFIGQHAGGGKAEQIFLRGFDVDHGTDVAISVDGMPVNMVSHAHGQGYADMHFIIPETIEKIDFGKGPHYANQGDFNTAGYVSFETKEKFDTNRIQLELGDFNTYRTLGLFNLIDDSSRNNASLALEYIESDGPFESSQNFDRINLSSKYTSVLPNDSKLSLGVSHFTSRWDASGQIPERAVESGLISRFGAIDDTEGGNTSRTNVNAIHQKFLSENSVLKTNAYYSHYDFELYSNFTFFLNDPVNGDQIRQREDRDIFGFQSVFTQKTSLGTTPFDLNAGIGLRNDRVTGNELSRTANRAETLESISLGNVNETNAYGFVDATFSFNKLKITPSLRLDYFKNLYVDELQENYDSQSVSKAIASPKLKLSYTLNNNISAFIKSGIGFHSNDTRVVVAEDGDDILPRAYGLDAGIYWKPFSKFFFNATAWYLGLEQEFVYVGDEGVVEPSGKSRRLGIDLSNRYQINNWLFFDTDFTYTYARSIDEPDGEDYIPLAPEYTAAGGLSINKLKNFSGGIRYRYLGDRAANEDYSITAKGYTVVDANVNYTLKNLTFGISVDNLFDTEWNEAQFATESRLFNETESVEEIHFTPGVPFFLKGSISVSF